MGLRGADRQKNKDWRKEQINVHSCKEKLAVCLCKKTTKKEGKGTPHLLCPPHPPDNCLQFLLSLPNTRFLIPRAPTHTQSSSRAPPSFLSFFPFLHNPHPTLHPPVYLFSMLTLFSHTPFHRTYGHCYSHSHSLSPTNHSKSPTFSSLVHFFLASFLVLLFFVLL